MLNTKEIAFLLVVCSAFTGFALANSDCLSKHREPEACLEIEECSYCIQAYYTSNRCNTQANLLSAGCLIGNILEDLDTNQTVTPGNDTEITLPVIPGQKTNITVTWLLAQHPLDLYYLMDFSGSMSDDKDNVVVLADKLLHLIRNVSSDSAVGFGTFIDKPVTPFGSRSDYSFRNNLKLVEDVIGFAEMIEGIPIRNGADTLESQADGMFQSVSCSAEIGWRSHARRLLLIATDADYHNSGDGPAGGITTPFDGECHMDSLGYYTEELKMDYPSEEQLISVFNQNGVSVIFAVTAGAQTPYQRLADRLPTSAVGVLSADSSNVLELIQKAYDQISSRFEIVQSHVIDEVKFKYYSNCDGDTVEETTVCEALSPDGIVTFTVEVDLVTCPIDMTDWKQTVRIHPLGLPTYIDIALSLICML